MRPLRNKAAEDSGGRGRLVRERVCQLKGGGRRIVRERLDGKRRAQREQADVLLGNALVIDTEPATYDSLLIAERVPGEPDPGRKIVSVKTIPATRNPRPPKCP